MITKLTRITTNQNSYNLYHVVKNMTDIGEISAAGITTIGTLAGIAIAYKATDSMMRNTGMYGKRKSRKRTSSIFG